MGIVKKNYSRGYSGWTEIENENYYCRSSVEFIYLHYFHKKYKKEEGYLIKMEDKIFYYEDYKYKPDIFIYHNGILKKIYEVKYNEKQFYKKDVSKYTKFKEYAKKNKIDYDIVFKNKNVISGDIKEKLKVWKKTNRKPSISGKNNPMFGLKHSEDTKKLIGEKTRERCQDPEYLEFLKSRMNRTQEQRENYRKSAIERQKRERKEKYGEIIIKKCVVCDNEFKDYEYKTKNTCKSSCTFKLKYSLGEIKSNPNPKKTYSTKIINTLKKYYNDIKDMLEEEFISFIKEKKDSNDIPKTFGLSSDTIKKYFNSYDELKQKIKEKLNEN